MICCSKTPTPYTASSRASPNRKEGTESKAFSSHPYLFDSNRLFLNVASTQQANQQVPSNLIPLVLTVGSVRMDTISKKDQGN